MEQLFVGLGSFLIVLMTVALYRVVKGPSPIDRIIAVNIIGAKTTAIIVLIGFIYQRIDMFVDLALAYAMLNFIASIAAARLFRRKGVRDLWQV